MELLILGGFRDLHEILYKDGHKLHLIIDKEDVRHDDINDWYDNIFVLNLVDDIDFLVEKLMNSNILKKVDRIIGFNEKWQIKAAILSKKYNLKTILDENAVLNTFDKLKTRNILDSSGINNIKYTDCCCDNYDVKIKSINFPCIVKPINGEGSKEINIIRNNEDIQNITLHKAIKYIVEEFIEGVELSVEALSLNGVHKIIAITRKYKNDSFIELGHTVPANIDEVDKEKIFGYIYNVLDALEIKNGPTHSEIIINERGPFLVETHTRLGGDNIYKLIEKSFNIDLLKIVADIYLGKIISIEDFVFIHDKFSSVWFYSPHLSKSKKIKEIIFDNSIIENNQISSFKILKSKDDIINPVVNSSGRVAYCIALGSTENDSLVRAKNIMEKIEIIYED